MAGGIPARIAVALSMVVVASLAFDLAWRSGHPVPPGLDWIVHSALLAMASAAAAASLILLRLRREAGRAPKEPGPADRRKSHDLDPTLPLIFHEIKNYAVTMKGNTSLLRTQMVGVDAQPSLERLERATERIEKLSREVMDVALMGRPGELLPVDMFGLVKGTAEGYFQGLELAFSIRADKAEFRVPGESRKLEQVFLNLFKNAFEAGAKRIDVTFLAQPGKVGILIEDDGKGCTAEQIEKMFDAYQSFKRSQGGTGLGLFLVKAIVEGHRGTISGFSKNQKSESGKGMVFVVQFPLVEAAAPLPA